MDSFNGFHGCNGFHGGNYGRLINWGSRTDLVPQNFINLLFAEEILAIRHICYCLKLSQVYLLSHTADHVFLFSHLNIQSLLFHLHGSILNLLFIGLKERFEYLSLNLTETVTTWRPVTIIITFLDFFKLILDVIFQLISSSNQVLLLFSHCINVSCQYKLILRDLT